MNVYLLQGEEDMIIEGGMSYIVPDMLRQFQERGINLNRITRLLTFTPTLTTAESCPSSSAGFPVLNS